MKTHLGHGVGECGGEDLVGAGVDRHLLGSLVVLEQLRQRQAHPLPRCKQTNNQQKVQGSIPHMSGNFCF
jgi:hypothetical protein